MTEGPNQFPIPDPVADKPVSISERIRSFMDAIRELIGYKRGDLPKDGERHADWGARYWLRVLFFAFALWLNLWWDKNVCAMLWQTGRANSGFHLGDKVLIALLTTSIANFLALLTIIARFLFHTEAKVTTQ